MSIHELNFPLKNIPYCSCFFKAFLLYFSETLTESFSIFLFASFFENPLRKSHIANSSSLWRALNEYSYSRDTKGVGCELKSVLWCLKRSSGLQKKERKNEFPAIKALSLKVNTFFTAATFAVLPSPTRINCPPFSKRRMERIIFISFYCNIKKRLHYFN